MRQLLEKIEENAKFIGKQREKVSFSLSDDKFIAAWEASVRTKGTPLSTFYENWSKINKIQKRKKITKNDEIADDLPMIKRPKVTTKKESNKDKNGPLTLFPSDSEDEPNQFGLEEDEAPKKQKKEQKKKLTKKPSKKQVAVEKSSAVKDVPDVVQDFSVIDW